MFHRRGCAAHRERTGRRARPFCQMDRLSVLSGGITGPRKGTRRAWEPRRRKKGGEYATGERDAFPHLGFPLLVSAQHKQPLKTRSVCCWAILARLLSGRLQSRRAGEPQWFGMAKFSFMFG